ncbi:precorrin-3B C(17)-methyltransferase [Phyllobacterium phragmitis]|uniref:Precorrin-3B C(17)-methyltransferase n=1 Tax=Phyllobacterium phragmitis TaxID=2670329 RepID=A0A2S9IKQ6_9HYPH|nr:precorrin-3B C(17)-methyltransferase [Phyllobacterium phragmitis]PRD41082.1 precorrin-3B C(17)-methyltransferase [Phyllobacterium phragmitis]
MHSEEIARPAILMLGENSLETAERIRTALGEADIFGLQTRVETADIPFSDFGGTLRELYEAGRPIIAICAAGIVIRALARLLEDKRAEPPVLAVAEDGSAVVPLLGGLSGVNDLARRIAAALDVAPAITTTGELRFGTNLLHPPAGYTLANPQAGKKFIADLLAGEKVRLSGTAPWLSDTRLPIDPAGRLTITITPENRQPKAGELLYHPRNIAIAIAIPGQKMANDNDAIFNDIDIILDKSGISRDAIALFLALERDIATPQIHAAAAKFNAPLRFVKDAGSTEALARLAVEKPVKLITHSGLALAVAETPADLVQAGRKRGRLAVVGLGPGDSALMAPAVRQELQRAEDILGYETYVRMAGPFRPDQVRHMTDNREEMQRARHAFALAATGRSVAMVSSGDPGIFAMAAAILEALHLSDDPAWHGVELVILPGISAAMAAAARIGAPLGHDFCILSLSDNLKPWAVIEQRLDHAARADLAMAFYNPISKARPWQLGQALDIIRRHRQPQTPVVLGRDVGRPAEKVLVTSLGELTPDQVDMRTVVIIGSSTTQRFERNDGSEWVYTPRWYGEGRPSS